MTSFNPEVPGYVQYSEQVVNHVVVQGGSNWDLSRSAVATPISAYSDPQGPLTPASCDDVLTATPYQPKHQMPASAPHTVVSFSANSMVLPAKAQKALKAVPSGVTVVVAGHADSHEKSPAVIARKRAEAVASYLRKQGKRVDTVRTFADELPLTVSPFKAESNRRVEVFVP